MNLNIHSSDQVTIIYIEKRRLLYFTIVGFPGKNIIKEALADLNSKKDLISADKLLVDTSRLGVLRKSDHDIIVEQMLPQYINSGVNKAALIRTSDVFGINSINEIKSGLGNIPVKIFDDLILAEKWLFYAENESPSNGG